MLALCGAATLAACGGSPTAPTALPPPTPTATPRPVVTIDPSLVRTGSRVVPSPTNQNPLSPTIGPPPTLAPTSSAVAPPPLPLPTVTTGMVLTPLSDGQTFTNADGTATLHYPTDWEVVTVEQAAQFIPRGTLPDDANAPRVNFIGQPVLLQLDNAENLQRYVQLIAAQAAAHGGMNVQIRSVDRVRIGTASGPPAVRFVVAYTTTLPVVSEQIITQPPSAAGKETSYFISATAAAAEFDSKWRGVIDGIAGSLVFK